MRGGPRQLQGQAKKVGVTTPADNKVSGVKVLMVSMSKPNSRSRWSAHRVGAPSDWECSDLGLSTAGIRRQPTKAWRRSVLKGVWRRSHPLGTYPAGARRIGAPWRAGVVRLSCINRSWRRQSEAAVMEGRNEACTSKLSALGCGHCRPAGRLARRKSANLSDAPDHHDCVLRSGGASTMRLHGLWRNE
jgi:hypothetical protein